MSRLTLFATQRQVDALKAMSKEVGSSWNTVLTESAAAWVAKETMAAGICLDFDFFQNVSAIMHGDFTTNFSVPLEVARLYKLALSTHAANWERLLDSSLLEGRQKLRADITTCMEISSGIACAFQRSIFIHIELNDVLNGFAFGGIYRGILQAFVLVQSGYFPASLMARPFLFVVGSAFKVVSSRDQSIYDYFSTYRDACGTLLGAEPKVITDIRQEVWLRALEVFFDHKLAERWLNKKMKRYKYLTPSAAVASGYVDLIFEHLAQIDNGFFG